jgi:hypothetical protein
MSVHSQERDRAVRSGLRGALLTAALLVVAGCGDDEIYSYVIEKSPSATPAFATPPTQATMVWDVPEGWTRRAEPGQMRVATFDAGSGDDALEIAVSTLGGGGGGLLANINRWRGQIGLAPIEDADIDSRLEHISESALHAVYVDLQSDEGAAEPQRIIGAVIDDSAGGVWFVKATGDPTLLESHAAKIRAFAASFREEAAPATTASAPSSAPTGDWAAPSHWVRDNAASSFVLLAYDIPAEEGPSRFTVTSLAGDGGGDLANINRWRGQVGLEPIASLDMQESHDVQTASGATLRVYEIGPDAGADGPRILAIIRHTNGNTLYYKFTGPAGAVERERSAFDDAVASLAG